MKIGKQSETNFIPDYRLATLLLTIMNIVDGKLTMGDNLQGRMVRGILFEQANFDYPIQHNLGRNVQDWVILNKNQFADFANGQVGSTINRLYLRCNTPNTRADILIWG